MSLISRAYGTYSLHSACRKRRAYSCSRYQVYHAGSAPQKYKIQDKALHPSCTSCRHRHAYSLSRQSSRSSRSAPNPSLANRARSIRDSRSPLSLWRLRRVPSRRHTAGLGCLIPPRIYSGRCWAWLDFEPVRAAKHEVRRVWRRRRWGARRQEQAGKGDFISCL
jgi:hypothetical protein